MTGTPDLSVCTTSYNSAPFLEHHVKSVYRALDGMSFEYVVVDNKSRDGTAQVLKKLASVCPRFLAVTRRCSRGVGRQLAAQMASATTLLCVDTDTIYDSRLRSMVEVYFREYRKERLAVQAIYAGLYPKDLWQVVGGMRDLNFAEDLDLWMRIWQVGRMRWTPVIMGENRKPHSERDRNDPFSLRYERRERIIRMLRREIDLWRVRSYHNMDLEATWRANAVDLRIGVMEPHLFGPPDPWSWFSSARRIKNGLTAILRGRK